MARTKKPPVKATIKQKRAAKFTVENGGNVSKAMKQAGYSDAMAHNPQKLTESKAWPQLMEEFLSEESLAKAHKELMHAKRLDHMVFPLGPESRAEALDLSKMQPEIKTMLDAEQAMQMTPLTDDDIKDLLASVNCTVRKIVHGQTGRHVYFWSMDARARKDALDMAYKLRGSYAPEKTFNVNVDVEPSPEIKALADKLNGV